MNNQRRKIERGIYEYPAGSLTYHIYYYVDGRRKKQKIGQGRAYLKIAREKLLAIRSDLLRGTYIDKKKSSKVYVKDFSKDYLAYCQSKTRMNVEWCKSGIYQKAAMKNLLPVFGNKLLTKVATADVDKYMMQRKTEVKNRTVNIEFAVLKHMFNMAIKWGVVLNNPTNNASKLPIEKKFPKFLTFEQIGELYNACEGHTLQAVRLAISTGMRRGELLSLEWEDIDFVNKIIYINKSKSGKPREIPMNKTAEDALLSIERDTDSKYVFCDKQGNKYFNLRRSYTTALKKAGLGNEGFVFHTLRHTFASHMVMQGVDIFTVKELLGHAKIETTMIYTHLLPKHKRLAVELGDIVFKGQQATKQPLDVNRKMLPIGNNDQNLYNVAV